MFDVSTDLDCLFQYLPILVKYFKKQSWSFAVLRSLLCLSNVTPMHTTNQQAPPYRGLILVGFLNEDFHLGVPLPYTETYCCLSLSSDHIAHSHFKGKKRGDSSCSLPDFGAQNESRILVNFCKMHDIAKNTCETSD